MGNWQTRQEAVKNRKEREKTRRDKLAGYFFNLSQLSFTALVLGGVLLFFQDFNLSWGTLTMILSGIFVTAIFAIFGNNTLKKINS